MLMRANVTRVRKLRRVPTDRSRRRLTAVAFAAALLVAVAAATALISGPSPGPARGGFRFVRDVPGARATIYAVGDGNAGAAGRALARRIAAAHPDRFLYLGDVYGHGTAKQFRTNYAPSFGRLARITAPTPGNHDWPNHDSGYDRYWRRAIGARVAHWYAFSAAGWRILSLNSEAPHDRGSPQYRWLRAQLRARGTCRIAYWHRPRFSAGTHHGDQQDVDAIWQALRGHAEIVIGGHEHDMQRFKPIDGMTQFVSGAGGKSHYDVRADGRLAFSDDTSDGALRLRLRPGAADFAFVDAAGRTLDRGTVSCRR
jgi:hypothetical protein